VVISQGMMCGWDLIEGELVGDVHVERPVTDERDEPFKELRVGLAVERLRFDVRCRVRVRLDAGGVRGLRPAGSASCFAISLV
jgi:hypothetical protein